MDNEVIHELFSYNRYLEDQMSKDDIGDTRLFHLIWGNDFKTYVTDVTYGKKFIGSMATYDEYGNEHFGGVKSVESSTISS
jgi:hypothetical protein